MNVVISNTFNSQQIQGYLTEIFRLDDELDRLTGQHLTACKAPRGMIREILVTARDAGINMIAFRQLLAEQRDERRHAKRVQEMDQGDVADLDALWATLGDFATTPLGQAAVRAAE